MDYILQWHRYWLYYKSCPLNMEGLFDEIFLNGNISNVPEFLFENSKSYEIFFNKEK